MKKRFLKCSMTYGLMVTILTILIMFSFGSTQIVIASPASDETIKIGVTTELTGALQVVGIGVARGVELCADIVNKQGGILGKKVEFIVLDDKTKPDEAVKNANYLIKTKEVNFIVQGAGSPSALAVSSLCKKEKIPVFCVGATEELTMRQGHRYVFRTVCSTSTTAKATAKFAHDKWPNKKRFFIFSHDFEYGRTVSKSFWESLKKIEPDAEMVGEAWPKLSETEYSNYIASIIRANPDIVFTGTGRSTEFYKQGIPFNLYKKMQFIAPTYVIDESFTWPKEDIPEGAVFGGTPYYALNNPLNKDLVNLFKQKYPKVAPGPGPSDYHGFVSALFGLEGIRRAGSTDVEKVVNTLEGLTIDTPVGKVTIRAIDHQSTYPFFQGFMGWDANLGHAVLKNVEVLSGEEYLPSEAEVREARKGM